MDHYEKEWLNNYDGLSPSYYTGCVDDVFLVFNSHDKAKRFFSYLNSRHLEYNYLYKLTYSGLLLNFDSFTSRFYKISLIKFLINRAYKIHNTWANFHNDVTKIKETLKSNSFPPFLIDKITKTYLDKVHSNSDQSNAGSDKTRFYKLPFIGKYSEQVQNVVKNL